MSLERKTFTFAHFFDVGLPVLESCPPLGRDAFSLRNEQSSRAFYGNLPIIFGIFITLLEIIDANHNWLGVFFLFLGTT